MELNINFYNNAGKLIQYVAHVKGDKLSHVVGPTGKQLSTAYGKRVFAQSQKGITLLSEARGHKEEIPRKYSHMIVKRKMKKPKGDMRIADTDKYYEPYNDHDMDRKIYVLLASNAENPDLEYWQPDNVEEYATFYYSTGYTNRMMEREGITIDEMGAYTCAKYIERGDTILEYLFLSE